MLVSQLSDINMHLNTNTRYKHKQTHIALYSAAQITFKLHPDDALY